jgi:hypothetical protein
MKNYFEVEETEEETPHRIHIKCGENARAVLIETDMGFIVDVYRNTDDENIATMSVWNDDLSEDEQPDVCKTPTAEEIREYYKNWGQKHGEICANLDYDPKTSDDLLMEDYFWLQSQKEWYPKISSVYSDREQEIADHLRNNS